MFLDILTQLIQNYLGSSLSQLWFQLFQWANQLFPSLWIQYEELSQEFLCNLHAPILLIHISSHLLSFLKHSFELSFSPLIQSKVIVVIGILDLQLARILQPCDCHRHTLPQLVLLLVNLQRHRSFYFYPILYILIIEAHLQRKLLQLGCFVESEGVN